MADVEECEDDGDGRRVPKVRGQPPGGGYQSDTDIRGWMRVQKKVGLGFEGRLCERGEMALKKWGAEVRVVCGQ